MKRTSTKVVRTCAAVLCCGVMILGVCGAFATKPAQGIDWYTGRVYVVASGSPSCVALAPEAELDISGQDVSVTIKTRYSLYAPGAADDAYSYVWVYYQSATYPDSYHTGQDHESGYMQVTLSADENSAALYQTKGEGFDWWGTSMTCTDTSDLNYLYFD